MACCSRRQARHLQHAKLLPSLPVWVWLALPTLALWPVWLWSARRLSDGSDDPLGIVALIVLLASLWRERRHLLVTPRLPWLLVALSLSAALGSGFFALSPLLRAVLAVFAVMGSVWALRTPGQPALAWLGLGLLALPVISSLQFYAGYPLRLVTAEVTLWILQGLGIEVTRQGSALEVAGRMVMVDAPCSGIQMGWVAYFTACATAAWLRLPSRLFLRRLPLLGLIVLGGNILRNTLLVLLESGMVSGPAWLHEAIGLAVFIGVCALVLRYMARASGPKEWRPAAAPLPGAGPGAQLLIVLGFIGVALSPLLAEPSTREPVTADEYVEWPREFEGRDIRPLALSTVEQRFAEQFPGAIARFTDGMQVISMRHVTTATRKLHPAADCYRGLGYRIRAIALEQRPSRGLQRCFLAEREGSRLRVCEYIEDAEGVSFTDTSAWYWSAVSGKSVGPWRAVTVASAVGEN